MNNAEPTEKPYREIPLTQGMTAIVDAEDFERLNKFKWYAEEGSSGIFYAVRTDEESGKHIKMHHEILGAKDEEEVDHRTGVGTDNRKANLRLCPHTQPWWYPLFIYVISVIIVGVVGTCAEKLLEKEHRDTILEFLSGIKPLSRLLTG